MKHFSFIGILVLILLLSACKKQKIADAIEESDLAGSYQLLVLSYQSSHPSFIYDSACIVQEGNMFNFCISIEGDIDCYYGDNQNDLIAEWRITEFDLAQDSHEQAYFSVRMVRPEKTRTAYCYFLGKSAYVPFSYHHTTHYLNPRRDDGVSAFLFLNNKLLREGNPGSYFFRKTH